MILNIVDALAVFFIFIFLALLLLIFYKIIDKDDRHWVKKKKFKLKRDLKGGFFVKYIEESYLLFVISSMITL